MFHFAAGHHDFKQGLKKGHVIISCEVQQKVTAIQLSLSCVTHSCSTRLSSSITLGNLLKNLSSPHFLSLLRVRGKLHATGSLVFPGILLLINMLLCFLCQRKQIQLWAWTRKWGSFQWALVCLCSGQAANCCTSSNFPSSPSRADAGHDCNSAQQWQSLVPADNMARYPPNPPNSPRGRHHFPPAYSVRNGGKKVKQPAQGHAESWGMSSGEVYLGPGRNLSLFRQFRQSWFPDSKASIIQYIFCMSSPEL